MAKEQYRRNRLTQRLMPLCVFAGFLTGCHTTADSSLTHTENIYSQQNGSVSMGAGDAIGWHLVFAKPGSEWATHITAGSPAMVRRLDIDPFDKHDVVGNFGSGIDPLSH